MEPILKKLILKRFRSFPSESVEFENPTILVGQNGAGKSNFTDAFAFLAETISLPLQAVFDKRGGLNSVRNRSSGQSYPPNLGIGVIFGQINNCVNSGRYAFEVKAIPNYGFEVVREQCIIENVRHDRFWFDRDTKFYSNAKGLNPLLDPTALCLPVVGGDDRFAPISRTLSSMRKYSIEPSRLREMQDPDSGISLRNDGSNAASVLQELIRKKYKIVEKLYDILEAIVPKTIQVKSKKQGNKLALEFIQDWGKKSNFKFNAFDMSDGTLRALGLILAVFQQPSPLLIAIEEPEATIHPGALGAILDLIKYASKTIQTVITTHSPELLDADWIKDHHIKIVTWKEGASHVLPLNENTREALKNHLMGAGELLRSNALDADELFIKNPIQAPLFEKLR